MKDQALGINGLGRIGKLSVWQHVERKKFSKIVVNIGRKVGTSLEDVATFIEKDSTYGTIHNYLYGYKAKRVIENLDEKSGSMTINGLPVIILRETRNPKEIPWKSHGVKVVVDTTGKFRDPTLSPDTPGGSVRGHLAAGARKVIVSAPFKIKDKTTPLPEDAVTSLMGINEADYDPRKHNIISNASCTTNCLAHIVKPILDYFGFQKILTISMITVHTVTGSQVVLDRAPKSGDADLRRNRSVFENIILTTTGAAKALAQVIPEVKKIGFMAESVRIPARAGSITIVVFNIQGDPAKDPITRDLINQIYKDAAAREKRGYLLFSDEQNVSSDIVGHPLATAIIEGKETETRAGNVSFDLSSIEGYTKEIEASLGTGTIEIPVTTAVVYGWYDNEMGGYTHMLAERTLSVASMLD
ncbi:MAG: glyceraldehyde-3-phosphate dehydrogenase [Deltaproteobacteria bacterium]|nr:glyceraldehyde-3-phosphate dehydrogenase [Deltaproteobacteria bacterium]